jgi:hypothetical protein
MRLFWEYPAATVDARYSLAGSGPAIIDGVKMNVRGLSIQTYSNHKLKSDSNNLTDGGSESICEELVLSSTPAPIPIPIPILPSGLLFALYAGERRAITSHPSYIFQSNCQDRNKVAGEGSSRRASSLQESSPNVMTRKSRCLPRLPGDHKPL